MADTMFFTPSSNNNKVSRGQPKKILSKDQLSARADLKTARSAQTKSETRVRKAIARMNHARISVDFCIIAAHNANAAVAAAIAEDEDDAPVEIGMEVYGSSDDDQAIMSLPNELEATIVS
jgi:hypothetical protein